MLTQYLTPNAANPTKETLVVEYYYPVLDDYFITSNQAEIQALDNGAHPGWTPNRTDVSSVFRSERRAGRREPRVPLLCVAAGR